MRITKLILENINSLYGKWEVDFTDPAFDAGIFAITGPTGSGKTTILDAMTLALYGKTARLGTNRTDAAGRGADSYLAELYFELDRHRYCCSFAHRKGVRNHQYGANFRHTLTEDGKLVTDKYTAGKVEELLGMKLEQFCRTVMLAQGKFDAFLTAGDDKSQILEQITGTEFYSLIGQEANARSVACQNEAARLETAIGQFAILSEDEEQERRTRLAAAEQTLAELRSRRAELDRIRQTAAKLRHGREQLERNRKERETVAAAQEQFRPDAVRLEAGRKAARIEPDYRKWSEARSRLENDRKRAAFLHEELAQLETETAAQVRAVEAARAGLERERSAAAALETLLASVTALDSTAEHLRKSLDETGRALAAHRAAAAELRNELSRGEEALRSLTAALTEAACYTEKHARDRELPERRARWEEQLAELDRRLARCREAEKQAERSRTAAEESSRQLAESLREDLAQQTELGNLQSDASAKRARLETLRGDRSEAALAAEEAELFALMERGAKIESFDKERAALVEGEPCPLCGNIHHPYVAPDAKVPRKSTIETRYHEVRKAQAVLALAERESRSAAEALERLQTQLAERAKRTALLEEQQRTREEARRQAEAALAEAVGERDGLTRELKEAFAAFQLDWEGSTQLPARLAERVTVWETAQRRLAEGGAERTRLEEASRAQHQRLEESAGAETELRNKLSAAEAELCKNREERVKLFADRKVAEERSAAAARLGACEKAFREAEVRRSALNERMHTLTAEAKGLAETEPVRAEEAAAGEKAFRDACTKEGLGLELFLSALLSPEELTRLAEHRKELETRAAQLAEERSRLEREDAELAAELADAPADELIQAQYDDVLDRSDRTAGEVGSLKQELAENDCRKSEHSAKLEELRHVRAEASLQAELADLIGGQNGQKFQRIAQSVTLGNLLVGANGVLRSMTDRYELLQSEKAQLEIDVIDHWQGAEIRSCANLSGGERFQVSLALALALSAMAGDRIRIDSLFLDEGFGTLDPNALELAIRTLANLRRTQGKTIGVISHMQAVAESIPTKIEVIPQGGGRSRLEGAGVRAL